jgi:hypothetical protein
METNQFLTAENAKQYSQTMDKYIYCQDLTDLPLVSKRLHQFEYEMWMLACKLGYCTEAD